MSDSSPLLALPYLQPSQAQKHVTHNAALSRLDALVQTVVADRSRTAPPSPVAEGAAHIVAPGATGDWAGQDHALAVFDGTAWMFLAPRQGWRAHVATEGFDVVFDGAAWVPARPDLDDLDGVGIGTAADAVNRLAVASEAALFTHAGAGHQIKVNKAAAVDTASLLFQTGWSGRAEMGTAGSDDFAIKVSADGAAWTTALSVDAASGTLSGAAVQQSADDATPGRLMRADWGYGPATLLGPVGLSGGTPTGAVIERGDTADGAYVRFADGTQIVQARVLLTFLDASRLGATWTFPRPFLSAGGVWVGGTLDGAHFTANVGTAQLNDVGAVIAGAVGADDCQAEIRTLTGSGAAFAAGDSAEALLLACGRWA